MPKQVQKITIEPRLVEGKQKVVIQLFYDFGHLPDFQGRLSWQELMVVLEDQFYMRDGQLFYNPERG